MTDIETRERVLKAQAYVQAMLAQGRTLNEALAAAKISRTDWAKHGQAR